MLKIIRRVLGKLILILDWLFSPRPVKREPEQQEKVDEATRHLQLYQFKACPFCVKVRRTMRRLALDIETCDALNNQTCREALQNQGGQIKVPCLKITDANGKIEWLYESSDIVDYLQENFALSQAA